MRRKFCIAHISKNRENTVYAPWAARAGRLSYFMHLLPHPPKYGPRNLPRGGLSLATICVWTRRYVAMDAGLMRPRPMCPRPKILGCCAPWTKPPLDNVSLTDVSRPWTWSTMKLAPSAAITASVGLRHLMNQWGVWPASPTPLTRFIDWRPSVGCKLGPHIRLQSNMNLGMGWFGQGQNSQGTLCPREATSKNFRSGTHRSGTD